MQEQTKPTPSRFTPGLQFCSLFELEDGLFGQADVAAQIVRIENGLDVLETVASEGCDLRHCGQDQRTTTLCGLNEGFEAKDYRDIAEILFRSVSLESGLGAFSKMFRKDPALPLRAIGFFKDGDLPSLTLADQQLLRTKRDAVSDVPNVRLLDGVLPAS